MGLIQTMFVMVMLLPAGINETTSESQFTAEVEILVADGLYGEEKSDRKVLMNNKVIEYKKTFYIT